MTSWPARSDASMPATIRLAHEVSCGVPGVVGVLVWLVRVVGLVDEGVVDVGVSAGTVGTRDDLEPGVAVPGAVARDGPAPVAHAAASDVSPTTRTGATRRPQRRRLGWTGTTRP